jgi:hypothetical protein
VGKKEMKFKEETHVGKFHVLNGMYQYDGALIQKGELNFQLQIAMPFEGYESLTNRFIYTIWGELKHGTKVSLFFC